MLNAVTVVMQLLGKTPFSECVCGGVGLAGLYTSQFTPFPLPSSSMVLSLPAQNLRRQAMPKLGGTPWGGTRQASAREPRSKGLRVRPAENAEGNVTLALSRWFTGQTSQWLWASSWLP